MATPKKYTPSREWNPASPPGLHIGARNLRESLKLKNPEVFKKPEKEENQKGRIKKSMALSAPKPVSHDQADKLLSKENEKEEKFETKEENPVEVVEEETHEEAPKKSRKSKRKE